MNRAASRTLALAALIITAAVLLTAGIFVQRASARGNVGAPIGQAAPAGHTIKVAGHGEVSLAPDRATVTLGVQSKDTDAQSALSSNNSKMTAIIAAVQGQGVQASHVQTSNLSIWYDSQHNEVTVSHDITVRLDDVNKTGPVIDAAVGAGANTTWGVDFGIKDLSAARSQALQAAVADARKRADSLAAALGVTVSGVGAVEEATFTNPVPIRYSGVAAPAPAPAPSTPVQTGQLQVTADINVVYTFG